MVYNVNQIGKDPVKTLLFYTAGFLVQDHRSLGFERVDYGGELKNFE
jgi:hypothetical protein